MAAFLDGKVAVVTGAGRGIGKAIVDALCEHGASVAAVARTRADLELLAREHPGHVLPVTCDLTDEEAVRMCFERIGARFGRTDILVNNAGQGQGQAGMIQATDSGVLDRLYSVNLRAVFLCCRAALSAMAAQRGGFIINIVSVAGVMGFHGQGAYCATKHGVLGLTKALSQEVATLGVRVSAILPGRVNTRMLQESRHPVDSETVMEPSDIAQSVLYLLSLSGRAHVDQIVIKGRTGGLPWL